MIEYFILGGVLITLVGQMLIYRFMYKVEQHNIRLIEYLIKLEKKLDDHPRTPDPLENTQWKS